MSPLGLGNDIGGSLRNPAHCYGIASIKPTTGVVPHATAMPPEDVQITGQLMLVEGVMARHVADVLAGLLAVAGVHHRDPVSVPVVAGGAGTERPLRIAVLADPPGGSTDQGSPAAIRPQPTRSPAPGTTSPMRRRRIRAGASSCGSPCSPPTSTSPAAADRAVMGAGGRAFLELD